MATEASSLVGRQWLTKHERRLVEFLAYNPEASLREAGVRSGYQSSPKQHAWAALQRPVVVRALKVRRASLRSTISDSDRLKITNLLDALAAGLTATRTYFDATGEVRRIPDYTTRLRYLNIAFILHGIRLGKAR